MKNRYKILGDKTVIFLNRKDGTVLETIIDTSDLERAKEFPNTWNAYWNKGTESYYVQGSMIIDGKRTTIQLHRWILGVKDRNKIVDHINHNTLDNTRLNLRIGTHQENQQNRKGAHKQNKSSGIRGVSWHKKNKKWQAYLTINRKRINIGSFDSLEDAEKAAVNARKKMMKWATN